MLYNAFVNRIQICLKRWEKHPRWMTDTFSQTISRRDLIPPSSKCTKSPKNIKLKSNHSCSYRCGMYKINQSNYSAIHGLTNKEYNEEKYNNSKPTWNPIQTWALSSELIVSTIESAMKLLWSFRSIPPSTFLVTK